MLRIAFASGNRVTVDQHFGRAESLVLYDVVPGRAEMAAVAAFPKPEPPASGDGPVAAAPDKVQAKLDFVKDCHAVYAASIGASSIRRLMALKIQPIIVECGYPILDLLNEISVGMASGGLVWIERAKRRAETSPPPPLGTAPAGDALPLRVIGPPDGM